MAVGGKLIEIVNAGQRRAYLSPQDGLTDCWIDQRLNAECTLTFSLPLMSDKWSELTAESRLIAGGREFIILRPDAIDTVRDNQGVALGQVAAQESWVLLNKAFATVSNDPDLPSPAWGTVRLLSDGTPFPGTVMGTAKSALRYLLQGTGWSVGIVDITGGFTLITDKENVLANISKVQETWGGFLVWDSINKTVSLRSELFWDTYAGFQVRYAKNLQNITRTTDNELITRIFPFGENDIGISGVNNGIPHLDNFSFTPSVYVGIYRNQGISDPAQLRDKAATILTKLSRPRFTYRTDIVDLRTLPEYQHEHFTVGDLVDVIDEGINVNIRARIIRHKYSVFQSWDCELEIGEPEERLANSFAQALDVAQFVQEALKPNPATANLLKGFISTFATRINSANGKLVWNDSTLEAIEIDAQGQDTGARVRITPGGIGISTDSGQTFTTAMTGAGVLANTIIVNELYALATDDGFTKLMASGLHVFDDLQRLRVTVGWWMDGLVRRFGLHVRAADGATTLLDDRGILQTWQEGGVDNVNAGAPMTLNVFLPPETRSIRRAILRFRLLPFRAYSTGAASGGGGTSGASSSTTTGASSTTTTTTNSELITMGGQIQQLDPTDAWTGNANAAADSHNHGIANGTVLALVGGGSVTYSVFSGAAHFHWLNNHTHQLWQQGHDHGMDHNHGMEHQHSVFNHTHGIVYGIFTSTNATGVTVSINGVDRTSALGGPFSADQSNLNIAPFLNIGQWNTIALGSSQLGRIDATVFIQALMGVI